MEGNTSLRLTVRGDEELKKKILLTQLSVSLDETVLIVPVFDFEFRFLHFLVVALTATAEHHNTYLKSVGVDLTGPQLLHLFASAGIY
jgi:hypothetical protein